MNTKLLVSIVLIFCANMTAGGVRRAFETKKKLFDLAKEFTKLFVKA